MGINKKDLDRDSIIQRYEDGETIKSIIESIGCCRQNVSSLLKENKVTIRPNGIDQQILELIEIILKR